MLRGPARASRAWIGDLLARFGVRQQRRELRAFVLDFDLAFEKNRLGVDGRVFGFGRKANANAERRPAGRRGIKVLQLRQSVVALDGKRIDA
jgi:hypothetical protein